MYHSRYVERKTGNSFVYQKAQMPSFKPIFCHYVTPFWIPSPHTQILNEVSLEASTLALVGKYHHVLRLSEARNRRTKVAPQRFKSGLTTVPKHDGVNMVPEWHHSGPKVVPQWPHRCCAREARIRTIWCIDSHRPSVMVCSVGLSKRTAVLKLGL